MKCQNCDWYSHRPMRVCHFVGKLKNKSVNFTWLRFARKSWTARSRFIFDASDRLKGAFKGASHAEWISTRFVNTRKDPSRNCNNGGALNCSSSEPDLREKAIIWRYRQQHYLAHDEAVKSKLSGKKDAAGACLWHSFRGIFIDDWPSCWIIYSAHFSCHKSAHPTLIKMFPFALSS